MLLSAAGPVPDLPAARFRYQQQQSSTASRLPWLSGTSSSIVGLSTMPESAPSTRSSSTSSLGSSPAAGAPHLVAASSPALGSANGRKPRRNLAKQTAQRCRLIEEKQRAMVAEQEATRERILRERKEKYRQVVLATKPDWGAVGAPKRRSEEARPGGADQEPWDQRWPMCDPAPAPARTGVPASVPAERTPKIKYKGTWDPQQQLRVARASAVEVVKPRVEPSSHLASAYTSRSASPVPPDSPLFRTPRSQPPPAPTPPGPPATAPSVITPAFGPSPTLPAYDPTADFSDSSMSDGDDGVSGSNGHRRGTLHLSEAAIRLLESNVKMKVSRAKAMMLGASGPAGAPPGGVGSAPRLLQPLPPERQRSRSPSPPAALCVRNGSTTAGRPKSARRVGGGKGAAAAPGTKSRIGGGEERSRTVSRIPLSGGDEGGVRRPSVAMARRWAHSDSLLYSGSTARAADECGDVLIASTATKLDSAIRQLEAFLPAHAPDQPKPNQPASAVSNRARLVVQSAGTASRSQLAAPSFIATAPPPSTAPTRTTTIAVPPSAASTRTSTASPPSAASTRAAAPPVSTASTRSTTATRTGTSCPGRPSKIPIAPSTLSARPPRLMRVLVPATVLTLPPPPPPPPAPEPDAIESQLVASLERLTVEIDARLARVGLLHPTPSVFLRGVPRPGGAVRGWPTVGG
ncbi:hypothetical protein AMAG_12935 [Allomyces macrogynus ATCC 38327]|uniref:Uncharacterized protein n=1 Tax=Allomyces macrogynus (strain ATCC 38327) TaxID=578462 RepID=A0A0L0T103_ALLM3|nr:hypothetical protein AMAG_12935 [Allomyces macrogynus ATCC 38327]|eukprot:KNE68264.1 hypothetical protein AMAG_12935 [Allomyces macrogynus ATCC 38327]